MVIDTTQTCSLCLLVFKVFPQLDMIRALLLMSCTCLLPALVKTFFMGPPAAVSVWPFGCKLSVHRVLWMILNGLAFLCQLAILVSFAFLDDFWFSELDGPFSDNQSIFTVKSYGEKRLLWWTVIPLIFVSIRWWENFINHEEKSEKTGVNVGFKLIMCYVKYYINWDHYLFFCNVCYQVKFICVTYGVIKLFYLLNAPGKEEFYITNNF